MKDTIPSCAIFDHFVDVTKLIQTASEPFSRRQENGHFYNSNSIEFDGIKTITAIRTQP